ncbi:salivary glue protein Sgs-5 [Drosophila albomicans]|uniref:Salivary glue protein Sgs-5 n=1 Tax=Drosophila albomicans TaxID=7291 RepID=A0A6P8XQH2_DROAB|nr:salivary glue protein Sgs-5 [Drosophila albomicans]
MFRLLLLGAAIFGVVDGTFLIRPAPTCQPACNIYQPQLVWVLEDCVCRPIQNPCCADQENLSRIRSGKTPLVPVTEYLCRSFIRKKCRRGLPVIAKFPKPPACGCKNKPGTIIERKFANLDELRKYSALNREAYTSFSYCLIPPRKKRLLSC